MSFSQDVRANIGENRDQPKNNTYTDILDQEHNADSKNNNRNGRIYDEEKMKVNVENVIQDKFEQDKIIFKVKDLLNRGMRGNKLAPHMKNEIDTRELISMTYIRRYKIYPWL